MRSRAAFTLVEALVSISIMALAASVLMLGTSASVRTTDEGLKRAIAHGMAGRLMDEALGARYHAIGVGGRQVGLGPSSYERQGAGRRRYDDIDDYHGFRAQPPEDLWGVELGSGDGEGDQRHPAFAVPAGFFDNWRQEVDVYYVDESDLTAPLPGSQVSDYRVVEVRIVHEHPQRGSRTLAELRRVVAYVPPEGN